MRRLVVVVSRLLFGGKIGKVVLIVDHCLSSAGSMCQVIKDQKYGIVLRLASHLFAGKRIRCRLMVAYARMRGAVDK